MRPALVTFLNYMQGLPQAVVYSVTHTVAYEMCVRACSTLACVQQTRR